MILFGGAEVITGFTHKFFGISTVRCAIIADGRAHRLACALRPYSMERWNAYLHFCSSCPRPFICD
jgi:hypothetical protein